MKHLEDLLVDLNEKVFYSEDYSYNDYSEMIGSIIRKYRIFNRLTEKQAKALLVHLEVNSPSLAESYAKKRVNAND